MANGLKNPGSVKRDPGYILLPLPLPLPLPAFLKYRARAKARAKARNTAAGGERKHIETTYVYDLTEALIYTRNPLTIQIKITNQEHQQNTPTY